MSTESLHCGQDPVQLVLAVLLTLVDGEVGRVGQVGGEAPGVVVVLVSLLHHGLLQKSFQVLDL